MNEFMMTSNRSTESEDNEPSPHELLNEATEWLQYSRGVTATLSDLVHEADSVDCRQMSLSLDAISAMTQAALHLVSEAHAQLHALRGRTTSSATP
ncbi:hypothetical protein [Luteibacter aegosomatissinici]|uniref:hypothetical protein n=1 Tax=Luteibacter aegosomatissinici TaxID=2911539 RepID=UPI001FFBB2A4|nr:hypothetical protein [Luteibacter aegosomatissinici]UPG95094.1 hypothetical protein L2Y97_03020 [Luteibacter aegosomatissinici]